jgi:hypothetical protein
MDVEVPEAPAAPLAPLGVCASLLSLLVLWCGAEGLVETDITAVAWPGFALGVILCFLGAAEARKVNWGALFGGVAAAGSLFLLLAPQASPSGPTVRTGVEVVQALDLAIEQVDVVLPSGFLEFWDGLNLPHDSDGVADPLAGVQIPILAILGFMAPLALALILLGCASLLGAWHGRERESINSSPTPGYRRFPPRPPS